MEKPRKKPKVQISAPTPLPGNNEVIRFETKEGIMFAIGCLLSISALKTNDPYLFFPCIGLAWILFIYIALIHKGSWYFRALFAVFITAFFLFVAYRSYDSSVSVPSPLLTSQLHELDDLQDLIAGKSEYDLKQTFDFIKMAEFNIALAIKYFAPTEVSAEHLAKINEYFSNGEAVYDLDYCLMAKNTNGASKMIFIPGKLPAINISQTYISNRKKLIKLESSADIPPKIVTAIKNFDDTMQRNIVILIEVINEKTAEDINNLIYDNDSKSAYFGAISITYNHKVIPLKPKADEIVAQIKLYMKSIK
jgi:hypothetical protein